MAKIDRKKLLKEPDEFLTFSDRAISWSRANMKLVIGVATAAALILAAVLGIKAYLDYHQRMAAAALAPVMVAYQQAVLGKSPDPKMVAKLAEQLKDVTDDYGATPAGLQARMALGDLQLSLGRFKEAVVTFSELTEEPDLGADLAPLAWRGLAQAQEGAGDYTLAAASYQRAGELAGPNLARLVNLERARVLAAAGDKNQAAQLYRKLAADNSDAALAMQAQAGLTSLGLDPETAKP